ncbi:MAG: SDR family oxidoreductase [Pseudomonadota bacterium]|nr:SDR family oxidoreductase [Pseudomonadota bacterium]
MLKDKIAIVTGGAQGIGRHAAKTLAKTGVKVVIADINYDNAKKTASELGERSETVAVQLDIRKENEVLDVFGKVKGMFGGIDILVNNAGVVPHFRWGLPRWPEVSDMPFEFWDKVISTNLYGTFLGTKHAIPQMKERGQGHIINLYGGGDTTPPGALSYMVTKDAIRTFTRFAAEEVRNSNICVLTFSPRFAIATETAPDKAKERMPGPEVLGKAFVLAAEAPMDLSGQCLAFEEGKLVKEVPMVG